MPGPQPSKDAQASAAMPESRACIPHLDFGRLRERALRRLREVNAPRSRRCRDGVPARQREPIPNSGSALSHLGGNHRQSRRRSRRTPKRCLLRRLCKTNDLCKRVCTTRAAPNVYRCSDASPIRVDIWSCHCMRTSSRKSLQNRMLRTSSLRETTRAHAPRCFSRCVSNV